LFARSLANAQVPDQQPNEVVDPAQCCLGIEVLDIIRVPVFDTMATPAKRCAIMGNRSAGKPSQAVWAYKATVG
jgi:hypothetical protein